MKLLTTGLTVNSTAVTSDKRVKFNFKQLTHALDVISSLEPVEYDQTFDLVETYTPDTPQSHPCGIKLQSLQTTDELNYAVARRDNDEESNEHKYLNFHS